jgi:AcrR family transcriptional regulator
VATTIPSDAVQPGRRERKKRLTKQQIAEAAWALFAERGFDRVTVAEIADVADVSEQTVFNYFPTKEDLVYWRLGSFEEELLEAIRTRDRGDSVLSAFGRFIRAPRGLLDRSDTEAHTSAAASARMIAGSAALQAREQRVFESYTDALADLIADELGAADHDVMPWVAANAMMGVHRTVVNQTRRGFTDGVPMRRLADDVETQADLGIALLERGLGRYAVKRAR